MVIILKTFGNFLFQAKSPLYIVHMMSKSALESLQNARKRQTLPVYGETLAATVGTDGMVPLLITR